MNVYRWIMKKKKEKMCESLYVFPPHKKRGNDRDKRKRGDDVKPSCPKLKAKRSQQKRKKTK